MKKIEIYKDDELKISVQTVDYDINVYSNSVEINCKVDELEITHSIPLNKGYKIVIEV